ncbi:hypothetical protein [Micromonospora citrea]|uniref:hypothetical protein n=1 Tax=Micromonospora citrea TaxID=47855 RepID=UPI001FE03C4A|nr:hypothetical protein [Micromonospora citrea]
MNPVRVARNTRSVPGNTSAYVAASPLTDGLGNPPGHDKLSDFPRRTNVTAAPAPPSENHTSATDATGRQPPDTRRNDRSTSTHEPSDRFTRCGTTADSTVKPPDGFANTCDNSVRADATSTRRPDRTATTAADPASGATDTSDPTTGLAGSARATDGTVTTDAARATDTAAASSPTPLDLRPGSCQRPAVIAIPREDENQSGEL